MTSFQISESEKRWEDIVFIKFYFQTSSCAHRPNIFSFSLFGDKIAEQTDGQKTGRRKQEKEGKRKGKLVSNFSFLQLHPFSPERQQRNLHIPRGDLFPALFLREKKGSGCLSRFNGTFFGGILLFSHFRERNTSFGKRGVASLKRYIARQSALSSASNRSRGKEEKTNGPCTKKCFFP